MAIRGLRSYIATNAVMFMGSFQSSCLLAMFHPSRRFSKFFDTEREPGSPRFRLSFTASNSPKFGPVLVVGSYAFSASDYLEPCAPYCGWNILLQSIEH